MADRSGEFSFFQGIHVRIDIRIDLHFYKTYDHHIWEAITSTGFNSNETNQAGASDVIMSRSHDELKTLFLHYHRAYGHKTWQNCILN